MKSHPSSVLSKDWVDTIRKHAFEAEQNKLLHTVQLQLIYGQQWFKMLAPAIYGGKELPLPELVRLEEAIAWADGSMGWVVTLCAGAGWFGGFMQASLAENIFSNPMACLAGSGAVTGTAETVKEGYKINGRWMHASGSPGATVFTANCQITEKGIPLKDDTGKPLILSFAFYKNEVSLIDTWHSMGMVATASHAYEVKDIIVPANRAFILDSKHAVINHPLYHYPFLQLAEVTLAANISGMAIHFIELAKEMFTSKKGRNGKLLAEDPNVASKLKEAADNLSQARDSMYACLDTSWKICTERQQADAATLLQVSSTTHTLVQVARAAVNKLYPYCGLSAADSRTDINRVWRDINTAGQHSLLVFGS